MDVYVHVHVHVYVDGENRFLSAITTHILDTSLGLPAANVGVVLEQVDAYGATLLLGQARSDADGRVRDLLGEGVTIEAGRYRLTFDVGAYFTATRREAFYPDVTITFDVRDPAQHYHVPLLVSPFGYSTYRGS